LATANTIRAHWGVENALHRVFDVNFRDDDCRIRKNDPLISPPSTMQPSTPSKQARQKRASNQSVYPPDGVTTSSRESRVRNGRRGDAHSAVGTGR